MSTIETYAVSPDISGKRLLAALGTAVGASAVTGALSYALLRFLDSSSRSRTIVFIVYTTLVVTLFAFFRPVTKAPIGLRFTSIKHLLASVGLLIATLGVTALFYRLMSPVFGDLFGLVRQIAAFATDAKRLQGEFLEWTGADHLGHTKFIGLRDDKDPRKIVKETYNTSSLIE